MKPFRPAFPFSWRSLVPLLFVLAAGVVAIVYSSQDDASVQGTFTTDHLVATSSIQLNSATATTLSTFDGSKQLASYAGSGCGAGSAVKTISASGGVTCAATGTGTITGTVTAPNLVVAASASSITDYAGSASPACGAGSAVSEVTISPQGSAQVTCITAGTGTVTSTGSAGWISQFSTATNIQNWSGSGCGAGSALRALDGSGNATCVATGASTAAISIPAPVAQTAVTVNLSTLGTTDWYWCPQGATSTTEPHMLKWSASQTSINGGFFAKTFGVISQQNWDTAAVQPITLTSNGSDSWNNAANSGTIVCETWSGSAISQDGFGWSVPASSTQQVMRVYVGGNNVAATMSCKLSVSGTTASQVKDFGSTGSNAYVIYTITFTGGVIGDWLTCKWLVSTANSTPTAIDFAGASLGPV